MASLRVLTNDPTRTIKRYFVGEGVITGLRIIVRAEDATQYNQLIATEVIKKRWTRLADAFEFQGGFAVNPQARLGHDLCIQVYQSAVTMNMPTELYQRFGVSGTKEKGGRYRMDVDRGDKRARECAQAWDEGVFGSPLNDTFLVSADRKVEYKSKQTFVDAEFVVNDPLEFIDAMGRGFLDKDGECVMHSFDQAYFSSEEIGQLLDLSKPFVLVCKKVHTKQTIVLVNNPGALMWTLHLEEQQ